MTPGNLSQALVRNSPVNKLCLELQALAQSHQFHIQKEGNQSNTLPRKQFLIKPKNKIELMSVNLNKVKFNVNLIIT